MRGEYTTTDRKGGRSMELPPRARRIQAAKVELWRQYGTTSACAENTCAKAQQFPDWWNYLRVRGEYRLITSGISCLTELPPRARRIPHMASAFNIASGTTSACAENTRMWDHIKDIWGNYLRVRGEYPHPSTHATAHVELPPRARRIRLQPLPGQLPPRTTSACAENTASLSSSNGWERNYLRVRGEYPK